MYIRKIWIENVRCFGADAQRVEIDLERPDGRFAGWTVFAGLNGAGKSTLLRSIALAVAGPTIAGKLEDTFAGWIRAGAPWGYIGVEVDIGPSDRFIGRGNVAGGKRPFWADLVLHALDEGPEPSLEGADGDPHASMKRVGEGAGVEAYRGNEQPRNRDRGPWAENPRGWFLVGYGPYRRLGVRGGEVPRSPARAPRVTALRNLFSEDAPLAECVDWLLSVYLARMEGDKRSEELERGVLALLNDSLLPAEMKLTQVTSQGLWMQRNGTRLLLQEMSDGYRAVTAFVLDLVRQLHLCHGSLDLEWKGPTPIVQHAGVVLLDEADIHLHVSWQQRLGFWLKEHFPNIQFLVTTHSPFICQAADPKGLIRLPAPGTDERVEHLSEEQFKTVVQGGADDAAMTALFGLEHTHSGPSEALRRRIAELEARSFRGRTTPEEEQELERLRAELPQTGSIAIEQALRNVRAAE